MVRRLFEQEIPEVSDGVITINELARESGYRSKVAVSSSDQRIDCVGACVGVRGNRIKNIVDELSGERIDIVRWNDDPEILIPNALHPAQDGQPRGAEKIHAQRSVHLLDRGQGHPAVRQLSTPGQGQVMPQKVLA